MPRPYQAHACNSVSALSRDSPACHQSSTVLLQLPVPGAPGHRRCPRRKIASQLGTGTGCTCSPPEQRCPAWSCWYWPQPLPRSARPAVRVMALKAAITARNSSLRRLHEEAERGAAVPARDRGRLQGQAESLRPWSPGRLAECLVQMACPASAGVVEELHGQGQASPGGSPHPAQPAGSAGPASPSESGAQTASRLEA